jgi:hypothetical protein
LKKKIGAETESDGRQHEETGEGFVLWLTWHSEGLASEYKYLKHEKYEKEGVIDYDFKKELELINTEKGLKTFMEDIFKTYGIRKYGKEHLTRLKAEYEAWQRYLKNDASKEDVFDNGALTDSWRSEQDIQSVNDMYQIRTSNRIPLDEQLKTLLDAFIKNFYETQLKGKLDPKFKINSFADFKETFVNNYMDSNKYKELVGKDKAYWRFFGAFY